MHLCRQPIGGVCVPPSVDYVSYVATAYGKLTAVGHVSCQGSAPVVEVGVCWNRFLVDDNMPTVTNAAHVGIPYNPATMCERFTVTVYGLDRGEDYRARLFARSSAGVVVYSQPFGFNTQCLLRGVRISVWAPTGEIVDKAVEDVWYDDDIVCWDFAEGRLARAKPSWIKVEDELPSGGSFTEVRVQGREDDPLLVVGNHRLFSGDTGLFEDSTDPRRLGSKTYTLSGDKPVIVSQTVVAVEAPVPFYNLITSRYFNCFANGILTSCRLSNLRGRACMDTMRFVESVAPKADEEEDPAYMNRLLRRQARSFLFLDHQGVMRTKPHPQDGSKLVDFDPDAVAALNALLVACPHVDIVVSSDWRTWVSSLQEMQEFYSAQGIVRVPVGMTPESPQLKSRSVEILAHPKPKPPGRWVALDDLDLATDVDASHFVHCPDGLHVSLVDRVRALL